MSKRPLGSAVNAQINKYFKILKNNTFGSVAILWICHSGDRSQGDLSTFGYTSAYKTKTLFFKIYYILASSLNNLCKHGDFF
jgi:hypothetical protein